MLLKVFTLKDSVEREATLLLTSPNLDMLKRQIKGLMVSQNQNNFNTFVDDKSIYEIGTYDTSSMIITRLEPVKLFELAELRDEIFEEARRSKALKDSLKGDNDESTESSQS